MKSVIPLEIFIRVQMKKICLRSTFFTAKNAKEYENPQPLVKLYLTPREQAYLKLNKPTLKEIREHSCIFGTSGSGHSFSAKGAAV